MCVTNLDAPSNIIGNQKQSFLKRRRNTSKPAWTNAIISLPMWFHAMECLESGKEAKYFYKTLREA